MLVCGVGIHGSGVGFLKLNACMLVLGVGIHGKSSGVESLKMAVCWCVVLESIVKLVVLDPLRYSWWRF